MLNVGVTYPDHAINDAIAIAGTTCLVATVLRLRPIRVERAVRPPPYTALPIFRNRLIAGLPGIELKPILARAVTRLR